MPIAKRKVSKPTYHEARQKLWEKQVLLEGGGVSEAYEFSPAKMFFYEDLYQFQLNASGFAQSVNNAKQFIKELMDYPDITRVELKGRWVYVQWDVPSGGTKTLPGGPDDKAGKEIVYGRK